MAHAKAPTVERHKSALTRVSLSRPVARALDDGLINVETSVLDYGCGRGGDVARLTKAGVSCVGYDPVFAPQARLKPADVVNLGYVVNVIEDPRERARTLARAWKLSRDVLVVSARLELERRDVEAARPYGDGFLTGNGTFQKLFAQEELRAWIESTLSARAVTAAPGVFYVFREAQSEQAFLARRAHRGSVRSSQSSEALFEQHKELLGGLVRFVEERGRLPRAGELEIAADVVEELGSLRRAFAVIKRITGEEHWDRVRVGRYEDLLVYLALARFGRRPRLSELPGSLQYDIKDFFGSYKAACDQADRLLFSIADGERRGEACIAAPVGKRTREALYVHVGALGRLPTLLRALEGCARVLVGTVEEATLVKFDLERPRVSYLCYPRFDIDAHPPLRGAYIIDLDRVDVSFRDYADYQNPPILHRKELFVAPEHPLRERFARLTTQEQRLGLYAEPHRIGTLNGWREVLAAREVAIRGHRAQRRKVRETRA